MSKFSTAKVVPEILELFLSSFFLKDFQVKAISFLALDKEGHMGNPAPKSINSVAITTTTQGTDISYGMVVNDERSCWNLICHSKQNLTNTN